MSTFCPNCGSELTSDSRFCPNCGCQYNEIIEQNKNDMNDDFNLGNTILYSESNMNNRIDSLPSEYIDKSSIKGNQDDRKSEGLAIVSMVLGIISLNCCFLFGIIGLIIALASVICGIVSLAKHKDGKGFAIAGITCSIIALGLSIVVALASASLSISYEALKRLLEEIIIDL